MAVRNRRVSHRSRKEESHFRGERWGICRLVGR